ncbi:hypothetical protein IJ00_11810 [Calothrix sp. 336/3]|nr:hypothetical protein IJ00_11810 [Calothrix sp. 336/3]
MKSAFTTGLVVIGVICSEVVTTSCLSLAIAVSAKRSFIATPSSKPHHLLAQAVGQNFTCDGINNVAKITWRQGEPRVSLGTKPDGIGILKNSPARRVRNQDGTISYIVEEEIVATISLIANNRCSLYVKGVNGVATVQEVGRIITNNSSAPSTKNLRCDARRNYVDIKWRNGNPRMTFESKPPGRGHLNDAPVRRITNDDRSISYVFEGETRTTVRFFGDNTCRMQIVDSLGVVSLRETGRVINPNSQNPDNSSQATLLTFQTNTYSIRVFQRSGKIYMNVYNKRDPDERFYNIPTQITRRSSGSNWTSYFGRGNLEYYARFNSNGDTELETRNNGRTVTRERGYDASGTAYSNR